jgi:hypothetical protein
VLPFPAGEQAAGVRERRHPSAADKSRVPTDVICVQTRAQNIVDVLGHKTGGTEIGEIGPVLPMIALLMRALLVIARAGVDQNGRARRLYDRAVKREDEQTASWVHQRRFEPGAVPLNDLGGRLGVNYGRFEQRSLKFKYTRDFDLAYVPPVNWDAGRRHGLLLLFSSRV